MKLDDKVTMKYRRLGDSDLNVSPIGVGGLHFGLYCDQASTSRLVHCAMERGVNFIDTAPLYGNGMSETYIGQAIRDRRSSVVLSTKVGLLPTVRADGAFSVQVDELSRTNVRASVERSLRALRTDYIDLLQIHAFDRRTPIEETLGVMGDLKREGKLRYFGCSNFDLPQYESYRAANGVQSPFVSFQVHYNMIEQRAEEEIFGMVDRDKVGLICNRALARGILTGKYRPDEEPPPGSRASTSVRIRQCLTAEMLRLVGALGEVAARRSMPIRELAISWLLAKPQVAVVLLGMRSAEQLDANLAAIQKPLQERDMQEIEEAIGRLGLSTKVRRSPAVFFET